MEAHEKLEQAENAEHIGGVNKKIALMIAIMALLLAFSETLGKSANTEAITLNINASNMWNFFQAKTIRRTLVQAMADEMKVERSEERRVGKECRSRWTTHHSK